MPQIGFPPQLNQPSDYDESRIAFRTDHGGRDLVIRPNEFLASGPPEDVSSKLQAIFNEIDGHESSEEDSEPDLPQPVTVRGDWRRYRLPVERSDDVIRVLRGLRDRGVPAQPNHVYFVSSLAVSASLAPNMFAPNMFAPNMFAPNMFAPNMFAGKAGAAGGCCCHRGVIESESRPVPQHAARPVSAPEQLPEVEEPIEHVEIHAIDVARPVSRDPNYDTGELDDPNFLKGNAVDENNDQWIDPATGHGDFVASVVEINSRLECTLWHAADPLGDIDDEALVRAMRKVDENVGADARKILNLSLAGYNEDDRPSVVLADQVKQMLDGGWLIVAAAGNNASCRLAWPAALPGVVAVAARDDCTPAWFSNYGPWIDASAPGVDVVAGFPNLAALADQVSGLSTKRVAEVTDEGIADDKRVILDVSDFNTDWARWSGTSFAAPLVTARLATALSRSNASVRDAANTEALDVVIRNRELCRVPYYGTLVS